MNASVQQQWLLNPLGVCVLGLFAASCGSERMQQRRNAGKLAFVCCLLIEVRNCLFTGTSELFLDVFWTQAAEICSVIWVLGE